MINRVYRELSILLASKTYCVCIDAQAWPFGGPLFKMSDKLIRYPLIPQTDAPGIVESLGNGRGNAREILILSVFWAIIEMVAKSVKDG